MLEKQKVVLFLGNADREGVTAKLKAVGSFYRRKMLESRPDNWRKIIDVFNECKVTSVVVKLTNSSFNILCLEEYKELRAELLRLIASKPNLILAHEALITGETGNYNVDYLAKLNDYDPDLDEEYQFLRSEYDNMFRSPEKEIIEEVIEVLSSYDMTITPYKKNVELSLIASSFIEKNENNLIFRIYVPSERMWASEAEKLLQLFRDYLHKVSGLSVRQDQYTTNQGVIYEFFGSDDIDPNILPRKFDEFSGFMESCVSNPDSAKAILESTDLNKIEIIDLVEKYSKEARRLHIDIKQERERKILAIRHGLESELSEHVRTKHDWEIIGRIVEASVPPASGISSALSIDRKGQLIQEHNLTININPQIIDTVNGVIAKKIIGDQHLGSDARQLLEIIDQYAGKDKAILTSSVHELSDKSAKIEERITAKHRLKGFVVAVGNRIGDVTTGILQSYIENQIGL
ncbi:hypothetical protein VAWG006_18330 [Aeromonas enteropelogenes]|uniref:Uncharacterized protein n=1 Tax=Aeromonas sp. 19NY04SH05-1 TaxID=2920537 RepID=A0AAU6TEB3_9GAMM|nr:hypothetical protein VAWG006_18330 [Aeromonas enteropelogenes]BEE21744.1 hypothetical protein VAWG007_18390 [Aeromonas enteropelogenes]